MPYINVKVIKQQVSQKQKEDLLEGLTALVVKEMNRSRELTNVILEEIDQSSWAIGGKGITNPSPKGAFVNIKVSRGSTNEQEMAKVIAAGQTLLSDILGVQIEANYIIIDELNPSGWGFGGISMTERAKIES